MFSLYVRPSTCGNRNRVFFGAAAHQRARSLRGPRERRFRLARIEPLELRTMLSTLTVINTNDSGPGSLREKLGLAAPGDTIQFNPSLAGGKISLASGELEIEKSVHLVGLGANQLTIDGNRFFRVFHVLVGVTADISGLTIAHGRADFGGGMFNSADSLTLTNVTFIGNTATNGGGMFNSGSSPLLTNVTFSGNTADYGGGMSDSCSSPTLTNVTFSGNTANNLGGGILNYDLSVPTLTNCILWGNTAPDSPQIHYLPPTATYSIVEGAGNDPVNHILDVNPLFGRVPSAGADGMWGTGDDDYGDLRVLSGSPAIDAGDNVALPPDTADLDGDGNTTEPLSLDLVMLSRQFDILNVADTGSGTAPLVDLGAYERHNAPLVAEAGGSYSVPELGSVVLSATGSSDPDGTIVLYEWDFDYNGTTFEVDATGDGPAFSAALLSGPEWRAVALRVTDDYGVVSAIDTTTVNITDVYAASYRFYVDADATAGANNGTSWANAFTDLQSALVVADPGDEIWVAAGTYKPTSGTNRGACFYLKDYVGIYGGFAGAETSRDQRNCTANVTTLSGDIGAVGQSSDNSYHVVWAMAVHGATLDGFTITGGNADAAEDNLGGGMYNYACSPTLANLIFQSNSAAYAGGGMYNCYGSSPVMTNVTFQGNSSGFGGGMANVHNSSPTLRNAVFNGNSAGSSGGGLYNNDSSSPWLVNVTLYGNSAPYGGGMDSYGFCYPAIRNGILWGNTASMAGAQIFNEQASFVDVYYSLVQGGWSGDGNLADDPRFVNAAGGDFHLRIDSPAIDAGTNFDTASVDRGGRSRPWDGNGDGTAVADMGAYERAVLFVDWQAVGLNNGTSWANAFTSLQTALATAVPGDEIWIAAGTYRPTAGTDRGVSFNLKTLLNVYGGFAAVEISREQRDGAAHLTTLSGDIGAADNADNSYHVVCASYVTDAVLADVTITGGRAEYPSYFGGGMYAVNSAVTLSKVVFEANTAVGGYGGGLYNQSSSARTLTLTDVSFRSNSATYYGGGMYNYYTSRANLTNVTFLQNSTAQNGGGMYNDQGSVLTLNTVTFQSNTAQYGGGMYNSYCSPSLSGAAFIGNSATSQGGAIYLRYSSPTVVNATFSRNSADIGGGIYACQNSSPQLTCVSMSGNSARVGGGLYSYSSSYPQVRDAILWGNTATQWGPQIADDGGYRTTVYYSIVQGGWTGSGSGVQNVDPKFAAPAADDLHLAAGSPAIDAGTTVSLTVDRDGRARPQDGNGDGSATYDMGAYEYLATAILYVKSSATGLNNGTSWTNAFTSLQSALALANANDEIWVAAGTYKPTTDTNRSATFRLAGNVSVFGGFAGTETHRAERNWASNLTTLSGDIGTAGLNTDNSYTVVWAEGVTNARLDGFTISGGYGGYGAGIYTWNHSSPALANLIIRDNSGVYGGGMYNNYYGEPTLIHVVFTGNSATNSGGAIYNYSSWPYLFDVTISGNSAALAGGAVYNSSSPNWAIFNTILWGNTVAGVPSQIAGDAILASYSIVQGGYEGGGNRDADPRFVDPAHGDFRVRGDSPAIDAGSNYAVQPDAADLDGDGNTGEPVPFDLAKNARFIEVPFANNTGSGDPPLVDIGAYEYNPLPPVANAGGPYAANETATISFNASASTDPNGDLLQYRWNFDSDGQWDTVFSSDTTATHSWNEPQTAVVTVQVSDGHAMSTATAPVQIGNLPPVAQNDNYETDEDHELIVPADGVLHNDSDPGGGMIRVVAVNSTGIVGAITWQADGSFTYDPRGAMDWVPQGGLAEGTVTYTIQDAQGAETTAEFHIQIHGVNDLPSAQDDALATNEDREIVLAPAALLANDTDVDGDSVAFTAVSNPHDGAVWLSSPTTGLTVTGLYDITSGYFSESAVTPDGKTLYVTGGNSSNLVTVVDVATRQVLRTITLPGSQSARAIAITPAGSPYPKRAYIGRFDGPIDILDLEPTSPTYHTVVKSITDWDVFGSGRPDVIAFTPDGSKVYVSNESCPNPVTAISAATENVLSRINLASLGYWQAASTGLAVSPDGTRVYVQFQFDSGGIAVIDTATNTPLRKISLSANGSRIAVTPDGRRAYTVEWNNSVLVLDLVNNVQVKTIPIIGGGHWVGISPDGKRLLVGEGSSNSQVIDTDPQSPTYETVIAALPGGTGYTGVTFSPYGHEAYATGSGLKIVGNFMPELHFLPAANFRGTAGFRYAMADGHGGTDDGAVNVAVASVNDPPTGIDSAVDAREYVPCIFTAAAFGFLDPNDNPPNAMAAVKITSLPQPGSLTCDSAPVSLNQVISVADLNRGALQFTPAPGGEGLAYAHFTFRVQDDGGTARGGIDLDPTPNTMTINLINELPVVRIDDPGVPWNEGDTFTTIGSFTDPDPDTWTAAVDYGDGSGVQPLMLETDKTFSLSHIYTDGGTYTVTVRVTDDDGGQTSDSIAVIVNHVPRADAGGPYVMTEGQNLNLDATKSYDPDTPYGDTIVAYRWDLDGDAVFDDATGVSPLVPWADLQNLPLDAILPVGLTVTDAYGASDVASTTLTILFDFVPAVTIEPSENQFDPTNASPITFSVVFSEWVEGFDCTDVMLGGTAGATTVMVQPVGIDGKTYEVTVSGMARTGTVIVSVSQGAAVDETGNLSLASNETGVLYDIAPPTVDLADPAVGAKVAADILNSRKYLDVSFNDMGSGLNLDSITDADQEFILEGAAASGVTVDGYPEQIGNVLRYHFTGDFGSGPVSVSFIAGAVTDTASNPIAATTRSFTVDPVWVIDDGNPGFATVGTWAAAQGYQGDSHSNTKGYGSHTASWTFMVARGQYVVTTTWAPASTAATNAPFTILDGTAARGAVTVNQRVAPSDFFVSGQSPEQTGWKTLGTFNFVNGTLAVRLTDKANGSVIADAVRIERLGDIPPVQVLDDGDSGFAKVGTWTATTGQGYQGDSRSNTKGYGSHTATWSFVVTPGQYMVAATWAPASTAATNAPYTVYDGTAVRGTTAVNQRYSPTDFFDPTGDPGKTAWQVLGTYYVTGDILLVKLTDKANGSVIADAVRIQRLGDIPPVQVQDDGDRGFATVGTWSVTADQGNQGDSRSNTKGYGSHSATWTFIVMPGSYRIAATWSTGSGRATNAPFTVYDGARALGAKRVDQNAAPDDFTDAVVWEIINTCTIVGNTLKVKLTDSANGTVVADAIRIERVMPLMVDAAAAPSGSAATLTNTQLGPITDEAIRRLTEALGADAAIALAGVKFEVADLPGKMLAETTGNAVRIDRDAAGYGWFVDPTPWDDQEFLSQRAADELRAFRSEAARRADLLTTAMHELGHVLGYPHSTGRDAMDDNLPLGTRRWFDSKLTDDLG